MTVLVTGAGLVGAQVARLEQEAGRTPVLFDLSPRLDALADYVDLARCTLVRGDLVSPLDLVGAITANDVTRIVHTAAYPGLTAGANLAPLAAIRVNLMGTVHVLEAARVLGLERVVLCSSSALYANLEGGADHGEPGLEEAYPRPSTIYATTKMAGEDFARNYASAFGVDAVAVRFAAVFGPWTPGGGGVATTAMEGWLRGALDGERVELMPARVEWVYSKDAAAGAHLACWADAPKSRVFNIGMGRTYNGNELADAFRAVVADADVGIEGGGDATMARVEMTAMSPERARDQLGYEPGYLMEAALADYRDWIIAHQGSAP